MRFLINIVTLYCKCKGEVTALCSELVQGNPMPGARLSLAQTKASLLGQEEDVDVHFGEIRCYL